MLSRKTVGLVLGSGSSRGWAHIGAIEALEEEKDTGDIKTFHQTTTTCTSAHGTHKYSKQQIGTQRPAATSALIKLMQKTGGRQKRKK